MNLRKEELHKVGEWTTESGVHVFPESEDIGGNISLVVVTKLVIMNMYPCIYT